MLKHADTELARCLNPGERLLWSGKPRTGLRLRARDIVLIPLSLVCCTIVIGWHTFIILSDTPFFVAFWTMPFVAAGLYFVFGRFFADALIREHSSYALTNERILIYTRLMWPNIKSIPLSQLNDVTLNQRGDGSGTIGFGPMLYSAPLFHTSLRFAPRRPIWPTFDLIDGVNEVYDIIRRAREDAGVTSATAHK